MFEDWKFWTHQKFDQMRGGWIWKRKWIGRMKKRRVELMRMIVLQCSIIGSSQSTWKGCPVTRTFQVSTTTHHLYNPNPQLAHPDASTCPFIFSCYCFYDFPSMSPLFYFTLYFNFKLHLSPLYIKHSSSFHIAYLSSNLSIWFLITIFFLAKIQ